MSCKSRLWLAVLAFCLAIGFHPSAVCAGEIGYDDYFTDEEVYDYGPEPGMQPDAYSPDAYSAEEYGSTESSNYAPNSSVEGPDAQGLMVTEIEVLNTITTTPEQVRYRMSTRVGHPLNETTLDGDFQRLGAMGVFDDIQIRKDFVNGGVKITVVVREKDIVRRIDFGGNKQIKTRKLRTLIETKVGERFDAGKGNRDRRAIEDYLHREYYYFGEVSVEVEPFEDGVRVIYNIEEGGRLYVADIQFRGNTVFTRKELLAKMETKRSGIISRGKYLRRAFERDLERIRMSYLDKGHLDVRVIERPFQITANTPKSRWQRRDVYIYVDIEEGEQYHIGRVDFDFVATSLAPEESIRALISTMPGGVYSPITIQEDARKIRDVYGQAPNSRYFTRVLPEPEVTEEGLVMDVTFRIEESPEVIVEGVRITGLSTTKEVVVLREFELFPGEKVDSRKFNRSKENIENLGYFKERPKIELREGSAPDRAIMVAELEEASTGRITAGVGVSSTENVVGTIGLSQKNFDYRDRPKTFRDFYTGKSFRGAGQSFSANVSAGSDSQNYNINFTNPWIFGKPISMSFTGFFSEYDYDDYEERRYGASLSFGKRLFGMKDLTASLGYKFEMVNLSKMQEKYVWGGKEYDGYGWEYIRQKGTHNVSRWMADVTYDSRDSVFEPTRGALASVSGELAGRAAGSSKDFWRAFLSMQYFIPFFTDNQDRNWTLGLKADAAIAKAYGRGDGKSGDQDYSNEVPYYERFHLGGVGSLRGFDFRGVSPRDQFNNEIGGEAMTTLSAELFFPIWERLIRGSIFLDTGAVWRYAGDPKYSTKGHADAAGNLVDKHGYLVSNTDRKFRTSWGMGLHVKTPLGPLPVRLYYSFPISKKNGDETQRFQFTMGALF